ncbi:HAD-IA family hydrolase [Shimia ponticola]|uniref:HAD-IA family hydrolase n=1 Tax=Shimia ponticola TaxID=2582893 RepID=UPI0011BF71F7|nr:HAD-IA family hydrolase [Shimia ponticola]
MRCVIFDLDGTLADTSGDLIAAANACFEELGLGPLLDVKTDAATALRGGRAMLRLGFSRVDGYGEAEVDAQYTKLLDHYAEALDHHTVLYPGAVDAVEQLRTDGFAVGICTNKPEGLAEKLMQSLGVRDMFGSLIGADTLPVRKPDPAPFVRSVEAAGGVVERSLLVGDSMTDERTARAAGVPSVSVLFGPDTQERDVLAPDAWLKQFSDMPTLADQLLS